jgi:hypothetical protein
MQIRLNKQVMFDRLWIILRNEELPTCENANVNV